MPATLLASSFFFSLLIYFILFILFYFILFYLFRLAYRLAAGWPINSSSSHLFIVRTHTRGFLLRRLQSRTAHARGARKSGGGGWIQVGIQVVNQVGNQKQLQRVPLVNCSH